MTRFIPGLLPGAVWLSLIGWMSWCAAGGSVPWPRHVIDHASRGADGIKFADINGDGRSDIVTGWEESGVVKAYLRPSPLEVRHPWPSIALGAAPAVEDAVFLDVNDDGRKDVLSSSEGRERCLRVHWGPTHADRGLAAGAWPSEVVPGSRDLMMWMFAVPASSASSPDLRRLWAGGKGSGAAVGWWEYPKGSSSLEEWKWTALRPVGWIMSLAESDMDHDGDEDLVLSDRRGERRGCFWLENPGKNEALSAPWREHAIGGVGQEVMFLTIADLDGDGWEDVLAGIKPRSIGWFRRTDPGGDQWENRIMAMPESAGTAKGVAVGDVDLDGRADVVFTCENADRPQSGVMWWRAEGDDAGNASWTAHDISGPEGVKFDLVELLDLDGDGDLDVVTCEERENLGVIWYENPSRVHEEVWKKHEPIHLHRGTGLDN